MSLQQFEDFWHCDACCSDFDADELDAAAEKMTTSPERSTAPIRMLPISDGELETLRRVLRKRFLVQNPRRWKELVERIGLVQEHPEYFGTIDYYPLVKEEQEGC